MRTSLHLDGQDGNRLVAHLQCTLCPRYLDLTYGITLPIDDDTGSPTQWVLSTPEYAASGWGRYKDTGDLCPVHAAAHHDPTVSETSKAYDDMQAVSRAAGALAEAIVVAIAPKLTRLLDSLTQAALDRQKGQP